MIFNNCTLCISARSPFARRVRLAFLEHGVPFEEKVVDVFHPPSDFNKVNPLLRVPVAVLKDGSTVVDSNQILQAFYGELESSPLVPKSSADKIQVFCWSGVAVGFCEKVVEYYLETLRPKGSQDKDLFLEMEMIFNNALTAFEEFLGNKSFCIHGKLTQADLDMGTALDYFSLRHPMDWRSLYPGAAKYLKTLRERPSFQKTQPPPP